MSAEPEDFKVHARREPWKPEPVDWGPLPLSAETVKEMERRVRTFMRGNPTLATYEKRLQSIGAIALKLIEDWRGYEVVEPTPKPALNDPDGGVRAD